MAKQYVRLDEHGVYRMEGHPRMPLDGIVCAYNEGDSPESIRSQWRFLSLEEIHGAIAFYLAHKQQVDEYLLKQAERFEEMKAKTDANPSPTVTRLRALAKERAAREG